MPPDTQAWRPTAVVVTCEHAGNEIPPEYEAMFTGAEAVLASHRGWDPGAMGYAARFAARRSAPLIATRVSRLLVEVNRSPDQPQVFSDFTRHADAETRRTLLGEYYTPHRRSVESLIRAMIETGHRVLHLGMHSFTDVLDGVERRVDIGLLFDPDRACECAFIAQWRPALEQHAPFLSVRLNEPYLGTDDGLTTHLRTVFRPDRYAGIEIEVRQGLLAGVAEQRAIGDLLAVSMPHPVNG